VDAGLDGAVPPSLTTDLGGQSRLVNGSNLRPALVDMGAYEMQLPAPAAVAGGPYQGVEGTPVALDATGSTGPGALIFGWDCTDDGSVDLFGPAPTGLACTYVDNGAFTTRLLVSNSGGVTATATAAVTVLNAAPVVTSTGSAFVVEGQPFTFTLGSFSDAGLLDAPWSLAVDWGDSQSSGPIALPGIGALPPLSHTYAAPGPYTVTLTVTDKDNDSGSDTLAVDVFDQPVANAGGPYAGVEGSPVALDGSGSTGAPPLIFGWDCTDDGSVDVSGSAPTGLACLYPDNGALTARLTVTNTVLLSDSATTQVIVSNAPPSVTPPPPTGAQVNVAQSFALGSFSDPGLLDAPWEVTVDWGDSTAATGFSTSSQGALAAQSHTYTTTGLRTVTVTVTDKDGESGSAGFSVNVLDPTPTPTPIPPTATPLPPTGTPATATPTGTPATATPTGTPPTATPTGTQTPVGTETPQPGVTPGAYLPFVFGKP
jgi:PKD repeat protein